ncbi:hypothetical protein ACPC54_31035 [Kitasatospora sp. NPDC094028]
MIDYDAGARRHHAPRGGEPRGRAAAGAATRALAALPDQDLPRPDPRYRPAAFRA